MSDEIEIELAVELGANADSSVQQLTLYIPDCDKKGKPIENRDHWVERAKGLLCKIGGGYTVASVAEGGWLSPSGKIIVDRPTLIYSYVKEQFVQHLQELREFLHDLGRETKQGEVAFAFDDVFYRITKFDRRAK